MLITEAEAPEGTADNALCLRRIAFYQRCGFAPVYRTAACGGVFQALAWGVVTDIAALQRAHRAIYGPARTDVQIPLDPKQPPKRPYWME